MKRELECVTFACLLLFSPLMAQGHSIGTNYLFVEDRHTETLEMIWDIAAADLHWALGLDTDEDRRIVWAEVRSRRDAVEKLVVSHLNVARAGDECALRLNDLLLTQHMGEPHVSAQLEATCPRGTDLRIASTLFADQDASQKTLLEVTSPAGRFSGMLSAGERWVTPEQPSWHATLARFVWQGMWHVWIGYDHIAFLLLLLLPSVLQRSARGWQAVASAKQATHDVLIVITAFTVAHSITLALATTGIVRPPVRIVEASIAASIVVAALLNFYPDAWRWRLRLAFAFGLMHGFGFANALAGLGERRGLAPALAGFNFGVELAQLTVVLAVLPWLLRARSSAFYSARFVPATSIAAAMAGALWFTQRV
jgi:hypothetical protein